MSDKFEVGKHYIHTNGTTRLEVIFVSDKNAVLKCPNGNEYLQPQESAVFYEEVKPKVVRYLNVYGGVVNMIAHMTKESAEQKASPYRTACIRVEFEEGQFDD